MEQRWNRTYLTRRRRAGRQRQDLADDKPGLFRKSNKGVNAELTRRAVWPAASLGGF